MYQALGNQLVEIITDDDKEALLTFYERASVYLKEMGKPRPQHSKEQTA